MIPQVFSGFMSGELAVHGRIAMLCEEFLDDSCSVLPGVVVLQDWITKAIPVNLAVEGATDDEQFLPKLSHHRHYMDRHVVHPHPNPNTPTHPHRVRTINPNTTIIMDYTETAFAIKTHSLPEGSNTCDTE